MLVLVTENDALLEFHIRTFAMIENRRLMKIVKIGKNCDLKMSLKNPMAGEPVEELVFLFSKEN